MGKPTLSNLKPFKKGQSGNPNGRPTTPRALLEKKRLTKTELDELLVSCVHMTPGERASMKSRPDITALEQMVLAIIDGAIRDKDHSKLNFLLDRIVGKVKDQLDVSVTKPSFRIEYLDNTREVLGIEETKQLGEKPDDDKKP